MSSNQHYAIVVLVFSIIYGILGLTTIEDGFFSDPIGPSLWVQGVAMCLAVLSLLLLFSPLKFVGNFPTVKEWLNRTLFILVIIAYSHFLPLLGFAITTPILITLISIFFQARIIPAIVSAVFMTIGCYIIFDIALGISLPNGMYFR